MLGLQISGRPRWQQASVTVQPYSWGRDSSALSLLASPSRRHDVHLCGRRLIDLHLDSGG